MKLGLEPNYSQGSALPNQTKTNEIQWKYTETREIL